MRHGARHGGVLRESMAVLLAIIATGWADVQIITDGQTVEYEQRWLEKGGWRWFLFATNNTGGVSCGLVTQRGENDNFPRHGFVVLASPGVMPPGSISDAEYNPTEYEEHADLVGPRFQYNWIAQGQTRPTTDWSVLTLGYDTNASATQPAATQIPLENVLIGIKCNEVNWQGLIPGCRYSLTVHLVPFELKHGLSIQAPMSPLAKTQANKGARIVNAPSVHIFRITLGTFDSLRLDIKRDGVNSSLASAAGLNGAALIHRARWSPPRYLDFPYNLSGACTSKSFQEGGEGCILPVETRAMARFQRRSLWNDKGLVYLGGCAEGDAGCRTKPVAEATVNVETSTPDQVEDSKQGSLRDKLWANVQPNQRAYAALHSNAPSSVLQRLCVGEGAGGDYYVTVWAADNSGDGRLHLGDGYLAAKGKGAPIDGVDSTGWRNDFAGALTPKGCWCCADGHCDSVCGPTYDGVTTGACHLKVMPNATARMVRGYVIDVTALHFTGGAVAHGEVRPGCVSYGQWRRYTVSTDDPAAALLELTIDADAYGVYAALGRPPTATDYDAVARTPNRQLSVSACDVTANNSWHVAVHLGEEDAMTADDLFETRYTLDVQARSAQAHLGQTITASSCCDATVNWRVPDVPSSHALRANVTLLHGSLHGIFVSYDSCPLYSHGDPTRQCDGLCEVEWLTSWDTVTSKRLSLPGGTVTVPMGETVGRNDERRAGAWYVGVKALPGETAEYALSFDLAAPPALYVAPYCSHLSRFCASETKHRMPESDPITTAADPRDSPLGATSAAPPRRSSRLGVSLAALAGVVHGALLRRTEWRRGTAYLERAYH
jgi:hypothetical protein